jgi:branched-subunit amino acid transport protein
MAVVTYIPRMIPLVSLKNVPYATLGALIVPGIFLFHENIWFGIIGAAAAFFIAFLGANVILVVLGSIAVLACYSFFS